MARPEESPIGKLLVEAADRAEVKTNRTASVRAGCGCSVTVHWFTGHSTTNVMEPCPRHPIREEHGAS